ncbi:nestin [Colossoma macropomum]|uniref:nestin n=1 Tax=Colossoma macropomum TaxID=42526 RepID=UPI0018655945|nr:nestin [Colossoma macropomum]
MEIPSVRQLLPHVGEEKYQMLELNKRLESYLGRVKLLEEENQLLRGEIQALQRNRDTKGQRQAHEEALNLARREAQAAWMKKDRVELEVSNLVEEMEVLNAQRQKERAAQAKAKRKLAEYKKMMEDEWRTQIWLREQAAHLENEVSLQVQVHQEEMASLKSTSALSKPILLAPQHGQTISLQGLGEEYSQRAALAWQVAAGVYQRQVEQLEDSLNQARAHMAQINQEKKENQLYVQDLAKELESTKVKRELLEKNITQQRERQNQELQQLQVEVEALESEKVDLGEQIGDLLVDTRDLLQTKMRLGLEVATYRALLDSESLRVNGQSTRKTSIRTESLLEALSKPHGIHPGTQTISASSLLSSPLTTSRSITHSKANLMTPTPSWSLTRSTQETPKRLQNGEKEEGISKGTATFQMTSIVTSTRSLTGTGLVPFTPEKAHEEVSCTTAVSDRVVPPAVDEPDSIPSAHIKEDLEEPTLSAHVPEDLQEPTLNAHVPEDLEEPTLSAHVKEDLEEPTLNAHVPEDLQEPTLNAHVKEDLQEPTLSAHVKDLQEPTLSAHVKDLQEPTLSAHVKDLQEPTLSAHVKEDLEEPTLSAHVKEDLEEPTLSAHVKEDLEEPTLSAHVKEDLQEPTLSAHVKEDLQEPTLSAHVKEDLEEPTLSAHVKEDLEEPTLSAHVKDDLEEPTLSAHVKDDLEEPTLSAHVIEDLEEPTLSAHVKEDLQEPTLSAHVKEDLQEPTLSAHVTEDLQEPTLSAHVKEDLQEPTLSAHVKEDLEEPTLSAHVKEDLQEPTLSAHVKEDLQEPTLSAHVKEDLQEPTLSAHVKEDLQEPTLSAHVKEDLQEPTLSAHVKEDLEEPTLSAHVPEDLQEPTLSAHVKEDLEEPTLSAHVKEDLEEPTLSAHVPEDLQEPTLSAHVKEDLQEPTLGAHVKEDLEEPTLSAHVPEDLQEPTLSAHVTEDLEEPTLSAHVKEDLEDPTLSAHVKEDLEEPTLSAHVKEDLQEPTLSAHVTEDLEEPTLSAHVKEDLEDPTLSAHVKEDLEEPTLSAHVKEDLEEPTLSAHVKEDLQEPTLSAHVKDDLEEPTLSAHVKEDLQEPTLSEHGKEDLEEILTVNQSKARQDTFGPEEAALISLPAGHLSSLPQTPEGEAPFNLHTEDTKGSEDGEEEETEVSTEMAQISHAPMFAWEENDTAIPEEKDVVSELESENTSENYMQECRRDNTLTDLKQLGEDSENPALPLFEQTSLHSTDAFSHDEKKSENKTWADDAKESVANIPGVESLESAPEVERESIERWEEIDTTAEIEDEAEVECCGTDEQEGHHSDVELQEEETKSDSETEESKVEVRKKEKVSDGEEEKEEEERKMDEDIAVIDENLASAGKEAIVQDSSALELEVDPHRNSEHTEQMTDLVVDTYQEDQLLVEDHAEEEQMQSDEDESLNISASWRTDLGEADSYAQENTLADTRPLIHYKSDEETDANTQVSHMGVSDSEEEREKHEEVLMWSQNIAKRFDTMEDLSDQPEIAYSDNVVMEESAQTVVEENIDEITNEDSVEPVSEDILQGESTDVDINVDLLKDDTLVDLVENDFRNREESSQGAEDTEKKNQVLLVQEQEENSGLQDWSFVSETERQALPFEQPATGEDDIAITNDNTEMCYMESFMQIKSEGEGESGVKTHSDYFPLVTDKPLLEPSKEQGLEEELHEIPSTETPHSDVFPTESNLTEEQAFTKEEDEQSNLSMLTHADFTDNLSQHSGLNSRPESQTNIANSDLEESNSSEDESPNASQCSQLLSHAAVSTKLLDFSNAATSGEASKNDSVSFTGLLEEVMKERFEEESIENYSTSQAAEWERISQNKEEEQILVDNSSSGMHGNTSSLPQMQEWEDLDHPDITGASNNILIGTTMEDNKASGKEDIFQGSVLNEEPQTKEKENDLHSFFTSSIKEDIWSATKFEMAATFDSNEPIDTTNTIHPNQSMTFEEDWGELGSLKAANGKPEKEMSISTAQSEEEEEREEQEMPQAKQLQCQDVKGGQVEAVQSDDSVDDGDSWSSGEA